MINFLKSKNSPKTCEFLAKDPLSFPLMTLLCGSVRSGKTINIIQKIPQIFDAIGNENLKVFSGYSKNTVRNNVLIELKPYIENYLGGDFKYNSSSGELDIKLFGKLYNCLVVGAGKADSVAAIQGGTWDFWYPNELTNHHYSFYNMALSRLTPAQARCFADANPESSNHWLYQERVKPWEERNQDTLDVFEYVHFTMDDNYNLSHQFVDNQKKLYQGAFYERKILGKWIVADGLVYDTFCMDKHTCDHSEVLRKIANGEFVDFFFGCDHGFQHPMAVCLFAVDRNGVYYIIDEFKRSNVDYTVAIDWIKQMQQEYQRFFRFGNCDNARPEINIKMAEHFTIHSEKPKVADSISLVRQIINFDRLVISNKCKDTIQEITTYAYPDPKDLPIGADKDMPMKEFDDLCDAFRYAIFYYETHYASRFKR